MIAYEVSCRGRPLLTKAHCHAKMNVLIARGIKHIYELKMGAPSSARMVQDADLELKALEMVYHANSAAVEGLVDRNGYRRKEGGKGKLFS